MRSDPTLHYLDNAATTIPSPEVIKAVHDSLTENWANPSALYTPGAEAEARLGRARAAAAKALGCAAEEFYFTGCGSESNNLAILGAARTRRSWGRRVVISGFEHPSAANPAALLAKEGFDVRVVPPGPDGHLDVDKMLALVDKSTVLVACMAVNNEVGTRVDIARLASGVKAVSDRTAVHVDAVQAWLRIPLELKNVDSLSVSGHKIHAPKGVGGLYLRRGYHIQPPYLGGGQERGIRPGTENLPYAVGLAVAARQGAAAMKEKHARMTALNAELRRGLAALPGITLNSPEDAVPEVLNFSLNDIKSETMLHFLEQRQVYVSSGSACSKGAASHTLTAMGCDAARVDTAIRVSLCGDNTPEDVAALLEGLEDGRRTLAKRRR